MASGLTRPFFVAASILVLSVGLSSGPASAQAPAAPAQAPAVPAQAPEGAAQAPEAAAQTSPATTPAEAPEAATDASTRAEVEALIKVLQNDDARARLIERLRAAAAAPPRPAESASPSAAPARSAEPAAAQQTLPAILAAYTREIAEGAAGVVGAVRSLIDETTEILTGAADIDLQALERIALAVALVVIVTFAVYLVLKALFGILQRRLAQGAAGAGLWKRIRSIGVSSVADLAAVLLAWAAGYAFALSVGRVGKVALEQSLFLNAFLIVHAANSVSRSILAPKWPALRIAPIEDTGAAYWYIWLRRLFGLVGYTFLFIAPILTAAVSARAAAAVRTIALFTALMIGVAIILQNRETVRDSLLRRSASPRTPGLGRPLSVFARLWHVLAITYLFVVFALWLADGGTALPFVLSATVKSAIAIAVGLLLNALIARLASAGMRLPADIKLRLPLLEARLNAFVPSVLRVVRVVVTIAVVMTLVQVWEIADVAAWLASEPGQRTVTSLISAALVLLAGALVYLAVQSWIEYRLSPNSGKAAGPRERTLLALLRNAFSIVLFVVVFMLVLAELGVNIGPLLAGAGVVGLAVGFGSQKLVQDVINGAFIQFENTMNEGDVVTVSGITGVVERLTIRSVSLRGLDGTYYLIPFSTVDTVSNLTKQFSYHIAAIGVAYRESIPEVKQAMQEAFEKLKQTSLASDILGDLEMQGITEFADSAVVVRARIKTLPGKQWGVGRAYNELIKEVFDGRGIEIPFPHVTLYLGEDKQGHAPALRVRAEPAVAEDAPEERAARGSAGAARKASVATASE